MIKDIKNEYGAYFDKIRAFKEQIANEKGIESKEKEIAINAFIENLFKNKGGSMSQEPPVESQIRQEDLSTDLRDQTFAGLYSKSKLRKHPDIVLLAVYYLVKSKNFSSVTIPEIESQYRNALVKKSSNTNMFVNLNKKRGYIMDAEAKDGKKGWTITHEGINHIQGVLKDAK